MGVTNWVLAFGVLFTIGILAKLGIHAIESRVARGIFLTIALGALIVVEHAIFDVAVPAGKSEMNRQIYKCTGADYYNPGCPGYPPPWKSSSP
jgi:hypothetical protein